jgi:hypothetical protein
MSRDLNQYKSKHANARDLALPYLFCQPQYGYPSVFSVENEPVIHLGEFPDYFPRTVESYLWTHKGTPGGSPWFALGRLDSGAWFYFFASCPESPRPFTDLGSAIHLFAAWNFHNLILHAMDQEGYEAYLRESRDQTDANTQTSHQASGASGLSGVAGLPALGAQFPLQWLHARELEYRGLLPGSAGLSESRGSSSAHTEEDTEPSDVSRPVDHPDS